MNKHFTLWLSFFPFWITKFRLWHDFNRLTLDLILNGWFSTTKIFKTLVNQLIQENNNSKRKFVPNWDAVSISYTAAQFGIWKARFKIHRDQKRVKIIKFQQKPYKRFWNKIGGITFQSDWFQGDFSTWFCFEFPFGYEYFVFQIKKWMYIEINVSIMNRKICQSSKYNSSINRKWNQIRSNKLSNKLFRKMNVLF